MRLTPHIVELELDGVRLPTARQRARLLLSPRRRRQFNEQAWDLVVLRDELARAGLERRATSRAELDRRAAQVRDLLGDRERPSSADQPG